MSFQLTVSDLRQYEYCERIVYFTHCAGLSRRRPTTYKMQEGRLEHERVTELEERRSLKTYGLTEGERHFEVALTSSKLGLNGLLDMVVVSKDEIIPVEYKNSFSSKVGPNHRIQLAAYALMLEEKWQLPVRRAFVHFIPLRQSCGVKLDVALKAKVPARLDALRQMIRHEALPDATKARERCTDCEFRNFCPDVW